MTHMPIKYLTREEVEEIAQEAGMGSFARQLLLEADFIDGPVRFVLIGNKLSLQKVKKR